mmetsp:Transcript_35060/g.81393  ORF Transcript_35060/g.81393 Transcript_35060/m.81393 type:complete len:843 (+) Transcript_35060:117-2645(+)
MEEPDSVTALQVLKRDYQETLQELAGSKALIIEPFRTEYENLYKALLRSVESENRLTKKIRDLNAEISASCQSVQIAMKTASEDQQQIAALRRDIDAQQKLVEQSLQKEKVSHEAIARYKAEIAELAGNIEQGAGMSTEQENQVLQLRAQKEQLEKDRDMLRQNTEMLQRVCSTRFKELQKKERELTVSEERIVEIKQSVAEKRQEIEKEKHRKEELEQQMKDLRVENEMRQDELTGVQRTIQREEAELRKIEQDVLGAEKDEERLEKRVHQKMAEKRKLEEKLEQELAKNQKYVQENQQRELALRARRDDIQQHNAEREKVVKLHEALRKKDRVLDEERKELEASRNELRQELKAAQEKTDTLKRDGDVDRKKIEDLLRERDILNKTVIKADERTKQQIDLVKRQETQAMNMQKDITRWKQDAQEFRKRIRDLEKQREKYGIELSQANAKYFSAKEELKTRGSQLTELKKQIANVQAKRNQQKNLYDAVCMDRNLHTKNLAQSNEEINEMRQKFKTIFHNTTALKEEIKEKEARLVSCHFSKLKVQKLNEKLKDAKDKANRRMRNLMNIVETQRTQLKKLESTIQEAEQERQAQQKELEGVIGERDILGAQLIRRNEELALLYEKIKIQQSTLQKGEIQYQERLQEVHTLRAEIRKSKGEVAAAKSQVVNVESLKREIHHLNKALLREETKAKALQEELENPMNVHRWRELEGSDPATYEMIQKVKSLQKLLIAKTEEVMERDAKIQEKEKLYVQLKNIITRQPGPEVAEQLAWYSQNLKEKTQHMKQMAQELEMYHTQVLDLREETERHNKDFLSIKQAYFQKLRQQRSGSQPLADFHAT